MFYVESTYVVLPRDEQCAHLLELPQDGTTVLGATNERQEIGNFDASARSTNVECAMCSSCNECCQAELMKQNSMQCYVSNLNITTRLYTFDRAIKRGFIRRRLTTA